MERLRGLERENRERRRANEILKAAPPTYYAARQRRPSARRVRDEVLKVKIRPLLPR